MTQAKCTAVQDHLCKNKHRERVAAVAIFIRRFISPENLRQDTFVFYFTSLWLLATTNCKKALNCTQGTFKGSNE